MEKNTFNTMSVGQINLDTAAGKWIAEIAAREDVKTIVEIGTWNGYGSTRCAYESIKGTDKRMISLETDRDMFDGAAEVYKDCPEISVIHGHITDLTINPDNLGDEFFSDYSRDAKRVWFEEDVSNIKNSPNVLDQIPEKIDFLILDGGEFSSWYEYTTLSNRCRYIFLDDTNPPCIKNYTARQWLLTHAKQVIADDQNDRNGYSIFEL